MPAIAVGAPAPRMAQAAAVQGCSAGRERPAAHGLVSCAISRREEWERRSYTLRYSGRVVELRSEGEPGWRRDREQQLVPDQVDQVTGEVLTWRSADRPKRGEVTCFSDRSRTRLLRRCAEIPWKRLGGTVLFVTLTYPGSGGPVSGDVGKGHLQALKRRWERRWGGVRAVWKQEFQRRGAVHYHLAVLVPGEVDQAGLVLLREWLARAWFEVVGSGEETHLRAGVQVDRQHGNLAGYFAKYVYSAKSYQEVPPVEWDTSGRWWGVWGLGPEFEELELERDQWVQLRRVLHRARAGRVRRRLRRPGAPAGLWVMSREEGGWVQPLERLLEGWLGHNCPELVTIL